MGGGIGKSGIHMCALLIHKDLEIIMNEIKLRSALMSLGNQRNEFHAGETQHSTCNTHNVVMLLRMMSMMSLY